MTIAAFPVAVPCHSGPFRHVRIPGSPLFIRIVIGKNTFCRFRCTQRTVPDHRIDLVIKLCIQLFEGIITERIQRKPGVF